MEKIKQCSVCKGTDIYIFQGNSAIKLLDENASFEGLIFCNRCQRITGSIDKTTEEVNWISGLAPLPLPI